MYDMTYAIRPALEGFATDLNAAYAAAEEAGENLFIDGRLVKTWGRNGKPASLWGTGNVSVDVRSLRGNKITQVWVRADAATLPTLERKARR
jgi:hypothetical protein